LVGNFARKTDHSKNFLSLTATPDDKNKITVKIKKSQKTLENFLWNKK